MTKLFPLNLFNTISGFFSKNQKLFLTTSLQFKRREDVFAKNSFDYIRLSVLELLSEEINERRVEGSIAELGVYQGGFAKFMSSCFPDRKFYLFDTFEGFHANDTVADISNNYSLANQDFSDTGVEKVLAVITHPDNCIIKKGYFPETTAGVDDKFAFVSLDTDLFEPIYQGLLFFYPRLSQGGYIMVHDYNNLAYKGVKEAVRRFSKEFNVNYIPIPDSAGTVIICK